MASAKQILGLEPAAVVRQEASPNTGANPLLLSSASEYVQAPTRADQSTFADGPTLERGALELIRSRNTTAKPDAAGPMGNPVPGAAGSPW